MKLCNWMVPSLVLAWLFLPQSPAHADYLGKSAAIWHKEFKSANDVRTKRNAAFALGKLGNEAFAAVQDLVLCLQSDKDADLLETAAYSLGQILPRGGADQTAVQQLCQLATSHTDERVKRSAAVALGNCGSDTPETRAALEQALDDANAGVRQNAAWALGEICQRSDTVPVAALRKALQDGDKLVKRDAAQALGKIVTYQPAGGEEAEQRERQRLTAVRKQAHEALSDLLPCVQHDYVELKKAACGTLINVVTPEDKGAAATLATACGDGELEVRRNAALALANIGGEGSKPAVPVLRDALRNGDPELRHLAALALRSIGPHGREAVSDLVECIANANEKAEVRSVAGMALQTIGLCDEAVKAIPRLVTVLGDQQQPPKVRERVLWALRVHGPDGLSRRDDVLAAMTSLLTEEGLKDPARGAKMLRYDSAFMLSIVKGPEAPAEVFPVLLDFLRDNTIKIFVSVTVDSQGTKELGTKAATAIEKGSEDGRMMALLALENIGRARVEQERDIVTAVRELLNSNKDMAKKLKEKKSFLLDLK